MHKYAWFGSKLYGVNEELLAEGVSAGRGWALVRNWHPKPRYASDRFERYILRVDVSEWHNAYRVISWEKMYGELHRALASAQPVEHAFMLRCGSPGWWENGFSRQMCLESVLFKYESEEDRLRSVVETGVDWDSLDYGDFVARLCGRLGPVFELFASIGTAAVPYADDF